MHTIFLLSSFIFISNPTRDQLDLTIYKKKLETMRKELLPKSVYWGMKYLFISSTYRWRIMKIIQFYPSTIQTLQILTHILLCQLKWMYKQWGRTYFKTVDRMGPKIQYSTFILWDAIWRWMSYDSWLGKKEAKGRETEQKINIYLRKLYRNCRYFYNVNLR